MAPAEPTADVDVVIPVYEGLRHVRSCITALARWTDPVQAHLIVVNDASSSATTETLEHLIEGAWHGHATVLHNPINVGFLKSANRGMRAGEAATITLLNSDTLVSPDWLDGLLQCLHSAPDVGVACPLSNYASANSLRAYYGTDHLAVAHQVRRLSSRSYPEMRLASGFCMAIRRSLADELNFFDEIYGRGYFEEADFCMRAERLGWRTLADDATYIHHHGWGSFGEDERTALMAMNRNRFAERWGQGTHERIRSWANKQRYYRDLERHVTAALTAHAQVRPRRHLPAKATRLTAQRTTASRSPR